MSDDSHRPDIINATQYQQRRRPLVDGPAITDATVNSSPSDCCTSAGAPDLRRLDADVADDPFLVGFRDCRVQVLRYLEQQRLSAEVGKGPVIDVDDSLVDSLRQHLLEAERRLTDSHSLTSSFTSLPVSSLVAADGSGNDDTRRRAESEPASLDDSALGTSVDMTASPDDSLVLAVVGDRPPLHELDSSATSDGWLSENAAELMRRACNNPEVGRVLDELFELMDYDDADEEEDDDDDCDDIGDDVVDDGVHGLDEEAAHDINTFVTSSRSTVDDVCST